MFSSRILYILKKAKKPHSLNTVWKIGLYNICYDSFNKSISIILFVIFYVNEFTNITEILFCFNY